MCDIFSSSPAYSQRKCAVPTVLEGLVLCSSLAAASVPYDAVDSDLQPPRILQRDMMSPDLS